MEVLSLAALMGNRISRCIPARQRKRKAEGNEQVPATEHEGQDQDGGFQQGGLTQIDPPLPNSELNNADGPVKDDEPPEDIPVGPPKLIYVSLYAFHGRNEGDLSFVKGEKIEILNNVDGDWWYGKSCSTKLTGYVPSNYIEPVNSLKSYE